MMIAAFQPGDRRHLRSPRTPGELVPEFPDALFQDLDREGAAGIGQQPQAGEIILVHVGIVHHPAVNGGTRFMCVHFSSWMSWKIISRLGFRLMHTFPPTSEDPRIGHQDTWKIGST